MAADEMPEGRHRSARSVGVLGPDVVGLRVVVRRLLPGETGPTGGPAMTDVLGTCESWGDGLIRVRRADGSVVEISTADIVSGKPVPPRPSLHRRLSLAQVDRLALPGWQPAETAPLGEWVLRASGGFSSRGNSVLAVGDPGMPLADAVEVVGRWYAARSLTPRAHVHPETREAAAFRALGWARYESTAIMLASVAKVLRRLGPTQEVEASQSDVLDPGWLATDPRSARYGDSARQVLEAGTVTFATVRSGQGEVLGRGRGALHGDWLGVSSLWTRADLRGTGLGSAVLESLLGWGAERGATTTYLQVVESNDGARGLYEGLGFEQHHIYDYLSDSAAKDPATDPAGSR